MFMPGPAARIHTCGHNYGMACSCKIVKDLIDACKTAQERDSSLYLMKGIKQL